MGGRTPVEHCLTLDVYSVLRTGMLAPGGAMRGTVLWNRSGATIGYQALLRNNGTGGLRLMWSERDADGVRQRSECWLTLLTTPQPAGGRRWWFVCPISGQLVAKVHKPAWSIQFASQAALGLAHAPQREGATDRMRRKAYNLRERLGDPGRIGDPVQKPNWMRRPMFDREQARVLTPEGRTLTAVAAAAEAMSTKLRAGR
jgi:hypothetical protein